MYITSVKAIPFRIPFHTPIKWAGGYLEAAEHAVVIIDSDEGVVGIGEAVPRPTIYGETLVSIVYAVENLFGPAIKGIEPFYLEAIWEKLTLFKNNYCAKGALDIALHDLIGKYLKTPVYKLLGGGADRVPLTYRVPTASSEEMINDCKNRQQEGYQSFKVKIGFNYNKDISLIKSIRHAVGPESILYVDANGNYDLETALKVLPELEKCNINYIEEPLAPWNMRGRACLSKYISTPILADDSAFTAQDVFNEMQFGSVGAVSIKVTRTGFYFSRKIAALAEVLDLPLVVGTQGETALGSAASLQFASACKQVKIPSEITSFFNAQDQIIKEELNLKEGCLLVNNRPGIGVTLDEKKLDRYRIT